MFSDILWDPIFVSRYNLESYSCFPILFGTLLVTYDIISESHSWFSLESHSRFPTLFGIPFVFSDILCNRIGVLRYSPDSHLWLAILFGTSFVVFFGTPLVVSDILRNPILWAPDTLGKSRLRLPILLFFSSPSAVPDNVEPRVIISCVLSCVECSLG